MLSNLSKGKCSDVQKNPPTAFHHFWPALLMGASTGNDLAFLYRKTP